MKGQMNLNLGWKCWTMLLAGAFLLGSCVEDEILENNHNLTKSESISFDAVVEWPEDQIEGRSALSASDCVSKSMLQSDDSCSTLPMGVYVQDGFYPLDEEKANSRGAVITELSSFNVWAALNRADNVGGGSISYISDVAYSKVGDENLYSSTGKVYYWPGEGPTLDFVAIGGKPNYEGVEFTPIFTDNKLTSFTYTVPQDATMQNDIVVAAVSGIEGDNDQSVPLDFEHIMSAVNVKIGSNITEGTIHSITFSNIKSTGTYNITDETVETDGTGYWEVGSDETDVTSYTLTFTDGYSTANKEAGTVINGNSATLMMLPQAFTSSSEIIVNFTHATTGNNVNLKVSLASIENHSWEKGKTTNYYININPDFTLSIEEESVPTADCHYDTRVINISDESNVGWTLTSDVDWVKFRVMPADYTTNANFIAYKDHWIETQTVVKVDITMDETKEDNTATEDVDERITRDTTKVTYPIVKSLSGIGDATVLVYYYENTGSSNENTARTTTISLKDNRGNVRDNIEIQQYYPLWGTGNIAYERIEEYKDTYPWGFASSRTITYTYPDCEQKPSWATGIIGRLIWAIIVFLGWDDWFYESAKETRGSVYNEFYTEYYLKAPNGFITISPSGGDGTTDWGYTNEWSVTLNYSKLNDITATNPSGLTNTQTILTYGGGETGSDAETYLISKLLTKGTEDSNTDKTTIPQTAAYQAVKKNRWNITTTITTTTTITEQYGPQVDDPVYNYGTPVLVDDEIKWFLPSNDEIATLKSTACDADDTNNDEALSGTYWTSTSAADVKAYEYAAEATSGTAVSRESTTKRKIRAARMKTSQ